MSRRTRRNWRISMALLILLLAAFANQLSVPHSAVVGNRGAGVGAAP